MRKNLAKLLPRLNKDEMTWLQLFLVSGYREYYYTSERLDPSRIMLKDAGQALEILELHWKAFETKWLEIRKPHAESICTLMPKLREYVNESTEDSPQDDQEGN